MTILRRLLTCIALQVFAILGVVNAGGENFVNRNNTGVIVMYKFLEAQNVDSTASLNTAAATIGQSVLGDLSINLNNVQWPESSIGIRFPDNKKSSTGPRAFSQLNSSALLSLATTSSFTIEMWLKPASSQSAHIMGLGSYTGLNDYETCSTLANPSSEGSFRFIQTADSIATGLIYSNSGNRRCSEAGSTYNQAAKSNHVVLRVTPFVDVVTVNAFLYFNGAVVAPGIVNLNSNFWNAYNLSLAFKFNNRDAWVGDIHFLAIYNRSLSPAEVTANYNAGLPNSRPRVPGYTDNNLNVSLDTTLNNMVEDTIVNITLSAYDFDGDTVTFQVVRLPVGTLYRYVNNTRIAIDVTTMQVNNFALTVTSPLAYLPPQDANGVNLTTFAYRGFDGTAYSSNRTISLTVQAVNDPPVANNVTNTDAIFARKAGMIQLSGYDIDANTTLNKPVVVNGSLVVRAFVATLPARGKLYQTFDGATPTIQINSSMLPALVNDSQFRLIYVSDAPGPDSTGLDIVFSDTFTFFVQDNGIPPLNSTNMGIATIDVSNTLQPTAMNITTDEDTPYSFLLTGTDIANQPFEVYLSQLPTKGVLTITGTPSVISASTVTLPYLVTSNLTYLPNKDLFASPLDSLRFFLRYPSPSNYSSKNAILYFNVNPVNDPPVLVVVQNQTTATGDSTPVPFSVILYDVDPEVGRFKVVISVTGIGGSVSLNTSALQLYNITFITGDGASDTLMQFRALPSVVNASFQGMSFQSAASGIKVIQFSVTDDGNADAFATVNFTVAENPLNTQASSFTLPLPYVILAWGAGLGCPILCCTCICFRKYKRWAEKRGKQIRLPFGLEACLAQSSNPANTNVKVSSFETLAIGTNPTATAGTTAGTIAGTTSLPEIPTATNANVNVNTA